jgi:hypothetical protein
VENSLWNGVWTIPKTGNRMIEWTEVTSVNFHRLVIVSMVMQWCESRALSIDMTVQNLKDQDCCYYNVNHYITFIPCVL